MNRLDLEYERKKAGFSNKDMAKILDMGLSTYRAKERGAYPFKTDEIIVIANTLHLTYRGVNHIFFDDKLPIWKEDDCHTSLCGKYNPERSE